MQTKPVNTASSRLHDAKQKASLEAAQTRGEWWPIPPLVLAHTLPVIDVIGQGPTVLAVATILCLALPSRSKSPLSAYTAVAAGSLVAVYLVLQLELNGQSNLGIRYDALLLIAVAPTALVMGLRLSGDQATLILFLRWIVGLATLSAALAIFEVLTSTYVVSNPLFPVSSVREGLLRARAIYPHPLVLAAILLSTLMFAIRREIIRSLAVRNCVCLAICGGAIATLSRGAVVVALVAAGTLLICAWTPNAKARFIAVFGIHIVAFGGVLWSAGLRLTGNSSATLVNSSDPDKASAQYRGELYRAIPTLLRDHPFGTGFGNIPENLYTFNSSYGRLDIARSIDSEIVIATAKFGWVGLLTVLAVFVSLVYGISVARGLGSALFLAVDVLMITGLYLSLESWLTIVYTICVLIGLAIGVHLTRSRLVELKATRSDIVNR